MNFIKLEGGIKNEDGGSTGIVEIGVEDIFCDSDSDDAYRNTKIKNESKVEFINCTPDLDNLKKEEDDIKSYSTEQSEKEYLILNPAPKHFKIESDFNKTDDNDIDWLSAYPTSEVTSTKQDVSKIKITRVPTSFVSPQEYTQLDVDKIRCNHCQIVSKCKKTLKHHIRMIHRAETKTFQCPHCPYKSKYGLNSHIISRHKSESEIQWFRCSKCDYKSKLKTTLRKHLTSHLDPSEYRHTCNVCFKTYQCHENLSRHKRHVHERHKMKKKKCSHCAYETYFAEQLKHHNQVYHTNLDEAKLLKCLKCDYSTTCPKFLKCHERNLHAQKLLQCEKCGYQTNTMAKMNLHSIHHKDVKDDSDLKFRCDKCDYKTYRQYSLNIHKLKHLKPEEIQYFYCYHCKFKAKRKDNLKTHVLRHFKQNEVLYDCYKCMFKTYKRHVLINHIDKHSKEPRKKNSGKIENEDITSDVGFTI